MENSVSKLFILFLSTALLLATELIQCTVTYDSKAIIINGQRRILISGSIHYPRSTPDMWEDLMQKAKDGGIDVIDTYVFWSGHEPSPGNYNFEGSYDLVHFVKTAQKLGLYVMLRFGPYVCAEWNFGGFPVWLHFVPGISFRTDNAPFMAAMQKFTTKIVAMMKKRNLFESQGGPIILSQIENEYGGVEKLLGAPGQAYMNWTASMAVGLDTGVPWVMCKQPDAPDPVINTFNGFYCDTFSPNKPYKPTMWTEAWSGWFTEFGGPIHKRPVEDLAFAVARFILRGGSFVNYYMYHGGTNFGRTSGGPFITTSYDYDAPIDEYGLIRDPKYGHLKELHRAIKQCEQALVSSDPNVTKFGPALQAHVFSGQGFCSAFLSNSDTKSAAQVKFYNKKYKLPPWSISILPNCSSAPVFNTAKNIGLHYETWPEGILGPVTLSGLDQGTTVLTMQKWTYKVGMKGEAMDLASPNNVSSVEWTQGLSSEGQNPLTWYRAYFDAPEGDEPLALDMLSMGKGQAWINGQSIGRYWPVYAQGNCSTCSYVGTYRKTDCLSGCGKPTQRWYHVPRSWLQPTQNLLVIFEELFGDVFKIALVKRTSST
ncbi:hypothetical protein RHGRI_016020 [Rhododendron griersonianum]|uniref:Beta-galactosidase n=1 Tax=Rhododendron griersonianum TaxID=479676 RepID=A0AAV6JT74_9ERIC|nr:hypothetical protein RHGRI_016020 [Rhododendron griersonianum]